jgi:hypothetical protein
MERLPQKYFHFTWDIKLPHDFPILINLSRTLTISSSNSVTKLIIPLNMVSPLNKKM